MSNVEHGNGELVAKTLEPRQDLLLAVPVECRERLVHENEIGRHQQRTRDGHSLAFAAGEKLHAAPEKMPDAQELHCFREAGEPPTGILVSEAKMEIALDIQMLE